MACVGGEPHDMQLCERPYEDWLQEMADEVEAERGFKVEAAMCTVCDFLGFRQADEDEEDEPLEEGATQNEH